MAEKLNTGDIFPRLTLDLVDGTKLELPAGLDARAFVGGTIDRFNVDFGTPLFGVAIELVDNGEGGGAAPDEISNVFFFINGPEEIQQYCDDHPLGPVLPIDDGDISVR